MSHRLHPASQIVHSDASPGYETATGSEYIARDLHNQRIVHDMDIDQLHHVENELTFYEKVPLLFLLGAHTPADAQCTLQQLLVNYHAGESHSTSNYLSEWALKSHGAGDWAPMLIEALAIVRANTILRRFGFHLELLNAQLLPRQPDSAAGHVHPILKWLVHLCEQLEPAETRQLIDGVRAAHPNADGQTFRLPGPPERYLELWLLLWLSERLITVGDYVPNATAADRRRSRHHCDVHALIRVLVKADSARMQLLGENLRSAQIAFNCTSEGFIQPSRAANSSKAGSSPPAQVEQRTLHALAGLQLSAGDDDRYVVRNWNAGYALIISQESFRFHSGSGPTLIPLERRKGTIVDRSELQKTLQECGYECVCHDNLSVAAIRHAIADVVRKTHESGSDSLIVCVMSHGFLDHLYGSDTRSISLNDIGQLMCSPLLAGKPKWLIVQACQGNRAQELVRPNEPHYDDLLTTDQEGHRQDRAQTRPKPGTVGLLPKADFIMAVSTIPGYVSYRTERRGSWFVQSLCEQIREHSADRHVQDILTKVINEVSQNRGPAMESMLPRYMSTLGKAFYLPKPLQSVKQV